MASDELTERIEAAIDDAEMVASIFAGLRSLDEHDRKVIRDALGRHIGNADAILREHGTEIQWCVIHCSGGVAERGYCSPGLLMTDDPGLDRPDCEMSTRILIDPSWLAGVDD